MDCEPRELSELDVERGKLVSLVKWLEAGSPRPTLLLGPIEETMSTTTTPSEQKAEAAPSDLLMPTLGELLKLTIPERRCLLKPWLREHESCLLYAATGVGKSLFALTAALAVAGNGSFFGWKPDTKADGSDWRVLYIDGEMHLGDIQERARLLMDAVPDISRTKAQKNLTFLARQQQNPAVDFPEITDAQDSGQQRILEKVVDGKFDLLILDNFSTLGRVVDENAASSFDPIQAFLLQLKKKVATILVHHTGKTDDNYRGSSKLAATFEIMMHLKHYEGDVGMNGNAYRDREAVRYGEAQFEIEWTKLRNPRAVGTVRAKLTTTDRQVAYWDYSTSLDPLNLLKVNLEAGLYATKAEIAKAAGRKGRSAEDIISKGVRLRVWSEANVHQWLTHGKKRRKAGETTAPSAAVGGADAGDVGVTP